jgi:hypothetical protein
LLHRPEDFLVLFTHELFMSAVVWLLLTQPGEITSAHMRRFHAFAQGLHWPNTAILTLGMDDDLWLGGMLTNHLASSS